MIELIVIYILGALVLVMAGCHIASVLLFKEATKYYLQLIAVKDARIALMAAQMSRNNDIERER